MSDLIERLRSEAVNWSATCGDLFGEAADEIERLKADRDQYNGWAREIKINVGEMQAEIWRLRLDCSELYQVIGTLSEPHGAMFDDPQVTKALDNASAAANGDPRPHDDLLPFTLSPHQPAGESK